MPCTEGYRWAYLRRQNAPQHQQREYSGSDETRHPLDSFSDAARDLCWQQKTAGPTPCRLKPSRVSGAYYFLFTDFFSSAPGLNFATLRAAILMVAPVCGLRPLRAFLCDTEKVPKPIKATRSPLRNAPVMLLTAVSIAVAACALLISQAPAILSTRSALFICFSSQVSLFCIPSLHREDKSSWLSWET